MLAHIFGAKAAEEKFYGTGGGKDESDRLTLDEVQSRVADMAFDIMAVLPGISFETVMGFYWEELLFWHRKTERLRGVT